MNVNGINLGIPHNYTYKQRAQKNKTELNDKLRMSQSTSRDMNSPIINSIINDSQSYAETLQIQRQRASDTKLKLKKLKYQFKNLSSRILRSKTSLSAKQAAGQARREFLRLKREKLSNQDDSAEMEAAIAHAKAMERIAKKKARHLEEEELVKTTGGPCSDRIVDEELETEEIEAMDDDIPEEEFSGEEFSETEISEEDISMEMLYEFAEEFTEDISQILEDLGIDELMEDITYSGEEMDPEDLKEMKIKHRNKEMKEIVKADAEYLKAIFDGLEKAKSGNPVPMESTAMGTGAAVQTTPVPVINITL